MEMEDPHLDVKPTLQRLPFYCTPPDAVEAVIPDPTPEDLVPLRAIDDDDGACVEIPLVTPLRSAVVIPSSGNQGGNSIARTAEGSNTRDSPVLRTELITPDLICPSTYQLLRNSSCDSGPDVSFDKSASPDHVFGFSPC
ncbi:hypothetical protein Tco_1573261 [Tanacetum coccineum]